MFMGQSNYIFKVKSHKLISEIPCENHSTYTERYVQGVKIIEKDFKNSQQ